MLFRNTVKFAHMALGLPLGICYAIACLTADFQKFSIPLLGDVNITCQATIDVILLVCEE